jgi:predicted dienelactone hydrolase
MWTPRESEPRALILFSHHSGGSRNSAQYLCNHLASHGYAVAALDHSDTQLPRPSDAGSNAERERRLNAWIGARVPDIRFLLHKAGENAQRVGIVGHSFGGWTALAAPTHEPRIEAVVALAPAGATNPRPGTISAQLDFKWQRDVATLVVAAENDVSIPLAQVRDVFDRIPSRKRLVTLPNADHLHFIDDAAEQHERVRAMQFPEQLAWMQREMRPFADLLPEDEAHRRIADYALAHFNAVYSVSGGSSESG